MSILNFLFGWKRPPAAKPSLHIPSPSVAPSREPYVSPSADRVDIHRGFDVQGNANIVAGYRFIATLQLRTPLRVLRRHGEVHKGIGSEPPEIGREMWEGTWLPETSSFRGLGLDLDELTFPMASDIGPVPQDGGDYLKFLIAVREAAEATGTIKNRRSMLNEALSDPSWRTIIRKLGGKRAILDKLFPPFVATVPRMSAKTAEALIRAGYASPKAIIAATDAALKAVPGIGPGTIQALRIAASDAQEPGSRYVDRVLR